VGMVVRLASCYGLRQVWFTGERVALDVRARGRLPREERMKGYGDVQIINYDEPFSQMPAGAVPVAVEVRQNAEPLHLFEALNKNSSVILTFTVKSLSRSRIHTCI
jgi:hypothetical protein